MNAMPLDRTSTSAAAATDHGTAHRTATATTAAAVVRPRVLAIGCGFGGLEAVRALGTSDVDITLVDRTNHHLFQPLLYQVATAGLTAPSVSAPVRHMLRAQIRSKRLTVVQTRPAGPCRAAVGAEHAARPRLCLTQLKKPSSYNRPMDTRTSETRLRLERVRDSMKSHGVAALLVPSSDPHLSEYLPERWQGRQWLSGFTGSMGTVAVTLESAALFVDSRYWGQAEAQIAGSGIELQKIPTGTATHHIEWLIAHVARGEAVAVDGSVLALSAAQQLRAALDAAGIALRTDFDLLNDAWPERPMLPTASVVEHRPPHATRTRADKLAELRSVMARSGRDAPLRLDRR